MIMPILEHPQKIHAARPGPPATRQADGFRSRQGTKTHSIRFNDEGRVSNRTSMK